MPNPTEPSRKPAPPEHPPRWRVEGAPEPKPPGPPSLAEGLRGRIWFWLLVLLAVNLVVSSPLSAPRAGSRCRTRRSAAGQAGNVADIVDRRHDPGRLHEEAGTARRHQGRSPRTGSRPSADLRRQRRSRLLRERRRRQRQNPDRPRRCGSSCCSASARRCCSSACSCSSRAGPQAAGRRRARRVRQVEGQALRARRARASRSRTWPASTRSRTSCPRSSTSCATRTSTAGSARAIPQGRAAVRPARHRQDAAGPRRRRRGRACRSSRSPRRSSSR